MPGKQIGITGIANGNRQIIACFTMAIGRRRNQSPQFQFRRPSQAPISTRLPDHFVDRPEQVAPEIATAGFLPAIVHRVLHIRKIVRIFSTHTVLEQRKKIPVLVQITGRCILISFFLPLDIFECLNNTVLDGFIEGNGLLFHSGDTTGGCQLFPLPAMGIEVLYNC
ncbi:hypothetical protein D3C76_1213600 [compost metagenome]